VSQREEMESINPRLFGDEGAFGVKGRRYISDDLVVSYLLSVTEVKMAGLTQSERYIIGILTEH
jgi:hypothetical protein